MMKKIIAFILISILLVGCSPNKEELNGEIKSMKQERDMLKSELVVLRESKTSSDVALKKVLNKIELETKIFNGYEPRYILVLEVKQTHFSLDISKHLKDAVNKLSFEMAVDKRLYDGQQINSELLREFRDGSFLFGGGSIGDWVITVTDKRIE